LLLIPLLHCYYPEVSVVSDHEEWTADQLALGAGKDGAAFGYDEAVYRQVEMHLGTKNTVPRVAQCTVPEYFVFGRIK
jgi:hypothetical protein